MLDGLVVLEEDHEDGDGAEAIEGGVEELVFGGREIGGAGVAGGRGLVEGGGGAIGVGDGRLRE